MGEMVTVLNGAHLHLIWKEASHSDGTPCICVSNFSHPTKLMPQEVLVNFLLSVSALSVHCSGPSPDPNNGAEKKGNAQIFVPSFLHWSMCSQRQSRPARLNRTVHADSRKLEELGELRRLSREQEKSPKCGRESWQKWKGGCWAKHALAPDAQSLQCVMLRICGCVYKTCHWLASTKDVASSYQKNVGFSLAEEGEWMFQ